METIITRRYFSFALGTTLIFLTHPLFAQSMAEYGLQQTAQMGVQAGQTQTECDPKTQECPSNSVADAYGRAINAITAHGFENQKWAPGPSAPIDNQVEQELPPVDPEANMQDGETAK